MKKYVLKNLKEQKKIIQRQKENEQLEEGENRYLYNTDFRTFLSRK
jgi:hypothetical protein